jgi:hypothetical protein
MSWETFVRNKLNEADWTPPPDQFAAPMSSQLPQYDNGNPNSMPQENDQAFMIHQGMLYDGTLTNIQGAIANFKFDDPDVLLAGRTGVMRVKGPFIWNAQNKKWRVKAM